jgi:ribosomal protein S18 acetylase RimI-like enzyme
MYDRGFFAEALAGSEHVVFVAYDAGGPSQQGTVAAPPDHVVAALAPGAVSGPGSSPRTSPDPLHQLAGPLCTYTAAPRPRMIAAVIARADEGDEWAYNTLTRWLLRRRTGYVMTLGVLPGYRRAGLGRRLLALASAALRQRHGCSHVALHCLESNAAGRALYASAGFEQVAVLPGHYYIAGGHHTGLYFTKRLDGNGEGDTNLGVPHCVNAGGGRVCASCDAAVTSDEPRVLMSAATARPAAGAGVACPFCWQPQPAETACFEPVAGGASSRARAGGRGDDGAPLTRWLTSWLAPAAAWLLATPSVMSAEAGDGADATLRDSEHADSADAELTVETA